MAALNPLAPTKLAIRDRQLGETLGLLAEGPVIRVDLDDSAPTDAAISRWNSGGTSVSAVVRT